MSTPTPGGPPPRPSMDPVPTLGPDIVVAAFTLWSIAMMFVFLRFYTRIWIVRALGWADYFVALAAMFGGGLSGAIYKQTLHGMGMHLADINIPVDFPPMLHISICLLYLNIFTLEWARKACYVILTLVILSNLWAITSVLTFTVPLAATWDITVPARYTTNQAVWWVIAGLGVTIDLLIFILPIPIVLPLKLPRRQKVAVVGIFMIGVFIVVVAFVRLGILIDDKDKVDLDFTWNTVKLTHWTIIECNTAIVIGCIMTLKPLISKMFPNLLETRCSRMGSSDVTNSPPLTIGSKPSRNPFSPPRRDSWAELPDQDDDMGDVMMRDLEAGPRDLGVDRPPAAHLRAKSAGEKSDFLTVEIPSVSDDFGHDASSIRTQELGPVATARSIG
ncbi:hypothetical protein OQA88_2354 [Cercophora sp. LCS_1]